MEKQKKQLLAMLVILIAAVIIFFAVSKTSNDDEEENLEEETYTVNDIEAEDVTRLIFTNSSDTVSLTKSDDEWIYEDDKSIDIDESAVEDLVDKVSPLKSEDCIENVDDLSVYGLDTPVRTIMVSNGDKTNTILVGDYNDITDTYYICFETDTSKVYTADYDTVYAFEVSVDDLTAEEEIETETEASTEAEETETDTEEESETSTEDETITESN
jgi:hypothetical protein